MKRAPRRSGGATELGVMVVVMEMLVVVITMFCCSSVRVSLSHSYYLLSLLQGPSSQRLNLAMAVAFHMASCIFTLGWRALAAGLNSLLAIVENIIGRVHEAWGKMWY